MGMGVVGPVVGPVMGPVMGPAVGVSIAMGVLTTGVSGALTLAQPDKTRTPIDPSSHDFTCIMLNLIFEIFWF
jgi:hypothetical protein